MAVLDEFCREYCFNDNHDITHCGECSERCRQEDLIKSHGKMESSMAVDGNTSDGYHTFNELYEHRIALFIALCGVYTSEFETLTNNPTWRSKFHSDGSSFDGWFILGLFKEKGRQITYHLPLWKWYDTDFAETLDKAPEFDGHTPKDVLNRLANL